MTALKIKNSNDIRTPGCKAFAFEAATLMMNPDGFSQGDGDSILSLRFQGNRNLFKEMSDG
jgi:hypothetical protein